MSTDTPVVNAVQVSAPKLTSIQLIEEEIKSFYKQAEQAAKNAEQAVANVHAIQGAIQGAQHLLAKLKAAEQAAVTDAKKLSGEIATDLATLYGGAKGEVVNGIHAVEDKL